MIVWENNNKRITKKKKKNYLLSAVNENYLVEVLMSNNSTKFKNFWFHNICP